MKHEQAILSESQINTPLGIMIAVGSHDALYLLEFADRPDRYGERLQKLCIKLQLHVVPGVAASIASIERELAAYFAGILQEFKTPLNVTGTSFQQAVWKELIQIPYGQTRSYKEQADAVGKQTAYRAVANANGANQIAIVIPCHRIINSNGDLGGYGGGLARKKWLINHERKNSHHQSDKI